MDVIQIMDDIPISDDCVCVYTYGEICVGCGCCRKNKDYRDRVARLILYYKKCIFDEQNFTKYSENATFRKYQERAVKANISFYKKQIRLYKKILKTMRK